MTINSCRNLKHKRLSQKEEVKQLTDVKFTAFNKGGVDKFTALIIYHEDSSLGKEDPQLYE